MQLNPEIKTIAQKSDFHIRTLFHTPDIKISKQLLPYYKGGNKKLKEMQKIQNPKISEYAFQENSQNND